MQLSYWKGALNDFKVNQQDVIKLKTGAIELAKEFDKLLKLYEKQDLSNMGLRETLKQVRREKELKEKQVQLANRTIERLSVKQGVTEAQDAVKDAQIRRLETKVASMRSSGELKAMCNDLEVSVQQLEQQLKVQEERIEDAERRARDAENENALLKRGIQIAADELTKSQHPGRKGEDVSSSLLLAVAKGQNEAVSLSKELADAKNKIAEMEEALLSARKHLTSQHDALMRWKEFEASQLKERTNVQQELDSIREEMHRATQRAKTADAAQDDMKKKITQMTSAYEMEKTRREAAEEKLASALSKHEVDQCVENNAMRKSVEQIRKSFEYTPKQATPGRKVITIEARAQAPPKTLFDLATMDIDFS